MKKILVTGVSGFVGSHTALVGLKRGYEVRGSVRSLAKANEIKALLAKYVTAEELARFSVVEADLLKPEGWDEAVAGMDAVLHVASPFILGLPKDENELIAPARMGVKHVLEAAARNGVKQVVQTSSGVAIMYGHEKGKTKFDENAWTNLSGGMITPYVKSKTLAEQDVWALAKQHPEMKITVINPGFILGPILGADPGTSGEVILKFMRGEYPGVPKLGFPTVDVRDVAEMHYRALETEAAAGQRYIANSDSIWFKNIAEYILEAQPSFSKKVKARQLPNWFMHIYAIFDKATRMVLPELGYMAELSNEKAKKELGMTFKTAREATMATANSLVELGMVKS